MATKAAGIAKWKFNGEPVSHVLTAGLDEARPKRGEQMFKRTDPSLGKPKPVTSSYGYEDAMRHGYLTEMEKQWLYWREAARREAERAKPWNTDKGLARLVMQALHKTAQQANWLLTELWSVEHADQA